MSLFSTAACRLPQPGPLTLPFLYRISADRFRERTTSAGHRTYFTQASFFSAFHHGGSTPSFHPPLRPPLAKDPTGTLPRILASVESTSIATEGVLVLGAQTVAVDRQAVS